MEAANAVEVLVKGSGVRKATPPPFLIALSVSFVGEKLPHLTQNTGEAR